MVSDLRSLQARRIIAEAVRKAFMEHRLDALVTPTLSATAVLKDQQDIQYESEAEAGTLSYVRTTAPFNLSDQPAISIPVGFDDDEPPIGLQSAAAPSDEALLLTVGQVVEDLSAEINRTPPRYAGSTAA
jgi:aspartyl-tRNA(Asn)/glutamyl-tRNA(Gln) amidotransferase subunit A